MATFLITGGAGFIGSNFCRYMVEKYDDDIFVCVDALTYAGNMQNISMLINKKNFIFHKGNICDRNYIYKLFQRYKFDYVVNLAAETHVDRSIENPTIFFETNVLGTQVLMDACLKYGIKRFHQVSTDEVYGDLPLDKPNVFFTEESKINPSSPYSVSKASADLLVISYHRTYGLPYTLSRCTNNYGPYQLPEKLIPFIIKNAINDDYLPIYGNGMNVRDWIYVDDHCMAIDLIVRNGTDGETYNIGANCEKTNLAIARRILKELDKPESLIKFVKDRPGHDLRYAVDSTKLKNELGWTITYSFEKGISETIKWNIENAKWLKNIKTEEFTEFIINHYANK